MVRVLPVPGPPAITAIRRVKAIATASALSAIGRVVRRRTNSRRGAHPSSSATIGEPAFAAGAPEQLAATRLLEAPVALEVQAGAVPDERPNRRRRGVGRATRGARRQIPPTARGSGQGEPSRPEPRACSTTTIGRRSAITTHT